MKISVIVPVFNVEDFLGECVDSVLSQNYQNFELILVDDGSTDGSADICDQYAALEPDYVKVVHVLNGGPLRARLIGVQESVGDALVFLDSDDCLRKDALEYIAACFNEYNCDMVLYNAEQCEAFASLQVIHSLENGKVFDVESKPELYKKIICGKIPNSLCLKAVRKECAIYPGYLADYSMHHGEDLLLSAYFLTNCKKVVYLNQGLYHYRNRPGSAIHSFNIKRKESVKAVHTELEKCIAQWDLPHLKPLHSTRKVRGWIDNLILLLKNRNCMSGKEFKAELTNMAEDPYFRIAYENMVKSDLSQYYSILASLLHKKQYWLLQCFYSGIQAAKKVMIRRKHDR